MSKHKIISAMRQGSRLMTEIRSGRQNRYWLRHDADNWEKVAPRHVLELYRNNAIMKIDDPLKTAPLVFDRLFATWGLTSHQNLRVVQ